MSLYSILLASYVMWSGALDRSDFLLLPYPLISLASHITIILISTLFYLLNIKIYLSTGLSVDLEKKKVVYPDWSTAKHRPGRIAKCVLTRNRERVYDVDFEDSSVRLTGVREEHIRLVGENLSGKLV